MHLQLKNRLSPGERKPNQTGLPKRPLVPMQRLGVKAYAEGPGRVIPAPGWLIQDLARNVRVSNVAEMQISLN